MKLYQKILLAWFPLLVINLAVMMTLAEALAYRICCMLLADLSALLGVVSLFLFRREIVKETRLFFVMLALLFFLHGLLFGLFLVTKRWLIPLNEWSDFFQYQYRLQVYFLLLSGCVVYLVVQMSLPGQGKYQKYIWTFVVAGSVWWSLFYPYYQDPKYLYTTSDVEDYRAVRESIQDLQKGGVTIPSSGDIASQLGRRLPESTRLGIHCSIEDREVRVSEIMPFLRGDDVSLLVLRPLWRSCIVMASFSIVSILFFILYQYLVDTPKSAYMEKVLWCLLPFCCFEGLHHYAFVQANHFEDLVSMGQLGMYASMGVMLPLLLLLILRLKFIQSVEGRFYESRLMQDASRITRWRDAFDNWVLRQFMNPKELEHRFLIQSKGDSVKDNTYDRR